MTVLWHIGQPLARVEGTAGLYWHLRNRSPEILEIPSSIEGSAAGTPSPLRAPWAPTAIPARLRRAPAKPLELLGLRRKGSRGPVGLQWGQ